MGRPKRITLGGYVYHVLNRANGRLRIFKKKEDFAAFEAILAEGMRRSGSGLHFTLYEGSFREGSGVFTLSLMQKANDGRGGEASIRGLTALRCAAANRRGMTWDYHAPPRLSRVKPPALSWYRLRVLDTSCTPE